MVNEPEELAGVFSKDKEPDSQFADSQSGEEVESYEDLLNQYGGIRKFAEGEVLSGTVLKITSTDVVVDIGYKSEGIIPINQFRADAGDIGLNIGDVIDVFIERTEDNDGHIILSKEKAEKVRVWEEIEQAYNEARIINGQVIERVKGGLSVDIGVRAFLPGSQIDVRPVKNLDAFKGQSIECRVIKLNRKRGNIVLSRKLVLEDELNIKKADTLANLEDEAMVSGVVKNIIDYGVFVDLGGIDGLLHVTDLSWGRINHPSEMFSVGDEITVKVLKFDREKERVSLGYKQLKPDPWSLVQEHYPIGARVQGKVVNIADYGAFVELEAGVEGLIHVSEMSWNKRVKHPSKMLEMDQEVEAVVLDLDSGSRRISLGLKQIEPDPWVALSERYVTGSVIEGKVRNLTDFGAFIEVEEGIDGLVHVSDISQKRINHPSEALSKGDQVQAIILSIDTENHRLALGIRQLQPDAWDEFFDSHKVGDRVTGSIVRHAPFGFFVELAEGVEGLCHSSEIDDEHKDDPQAQFKVGEDVELRVIKLNQGDRKVGLSYRALSEDVIREEVDHYIAAEDGSATLADLFDAKGAENG